MPFLDYLIGGSLRTDYAIKAVEIRSKISDHAREVTDPGLLEDIYNNPIAMDMLKRKNIKLSWPTGFSSQIYRFLYRFFNSICRGTISLLLSPLSLVVGLFASRDMQSAIYSFFDVRRKKAEKGDVTVFDVIESTAAQIGKKAKSRPTIVKGPNDPGAAFYDSVCNIVSIPNGIGKTVVRTGDVLPVTQPWTSFGPPTALAIAFHEMGHAEQRKFLLALLAIKILAILFSVVFISRLSLPVFLGGGVGLILILPAIMVFPIVQFLYERDASERAIVNLIADKHITTKEAAIEAVCLLQAAACTYLMSTVIECIKAWRKYMPKNSAEDSASEATSA
ncbi:MAG: zinc metallopeptidase [Puniceicoccales bacterium]|jgi:Zn-dependent protease with chaperone function|nr:zinc metallopeptidase [Puniceicoccales bacterium]